MALSQFRAGIFVFALLLGVHAGWVIAVEIARPPRPAFPRPQEPPPVTQEERSRAATAATLGAVRGDLWAEDAALMAGGLEHDIEVGRADDAPDTLLAARALAERAARLSPHESRIWLLIAALDARLHRAQTGVETPLKMSYYTGASDPALMGFRLLIATASPAIADPDLQALVSGELRTVVTTEPHLKPAILAAYRRAAPRGRETIEATLRDFDPALLATARRSIAPD